MPLAEQHWHAAEKSGFWAFDVIPAEAGIQSFLAFLNSRMRGSDERVVFFSNLLAESQPGERGSPYKTIHFDVEALQLPE